MVAIETVEVRHVAAARFVPIQLPDVIAIDVPAGQPVQLSIEVLRDVFMRDDLRAWTEDRAALGMVEIVVAVDDITDRLLKRRSSSGFSQVACSVLTGSPRMMPSGVTRNTVFAPPLT